MSYAIAVEIGIPLYLLEKTVSLSKDEKKKAIKLAESGEVDATLEADRERRKKEAKDALRGRAASKAAATELAKLVRDVAKVAPVVIPLDKTIHSILPEECRNSKVVSQVSESKALNQVKMEVAKQAANALEALIKAMERSK